MSKHVLLFGVSNQEDLFDIYQPYPVRVRPAGSGSNDFRKWMDENCVNSRFGPEEADATRYEHSYYSK